MMPLLPVKKHDIAVGRRLRSARKSLGLSQGEAARRMGVSRDLLASYEALRAPVRWDFGILFCIEFKVSITWLATGTQDGEDIPSRLPITYTVDVPGKLSFADAYEKYLTAPVNNWPVESRRSAHESKQALLKAVDFWLRSLPDEEVGQFVKFIWRVGEDYRVKTKTARMRLFLEQRKALGLEHPTEPEDLFGS